jgi:hypothetical protein
MRLVHQLKNRFVPVISSLWTGRKISYYSTIYIGHVRVTTVDFAVVQEIFSVDEQHSFLQVRCLSNSRPGRSIQLPEPKKAGTVPAISVLDHAGFRRFQPFPSSF